MSKFALEETKFQQAACCSQDKDIVTFRALKKQYIESLNDKKK